jgi:3',5'-cyclic-AMP phosphodiesterase
VLIAQLSDIHAPVGLGGLDRASDYLTGFDLAAVLVSGDLSNPPHERGYPAVAERLGRLDAPVFVVPGNVDDRDAMRSTFENFGLWPASGSMTYEAMLGGKVRLIALDTTIPGEIGGELRPADLDLVARRIRPSSEPVLLMMHQHVFQMGIESLDGYRCAGAEGLEKLLSGEPHAVAAILCGHGHRSIATQFAGVTAIMAPSLRPGNPLAFDGQTEPALTDPPGLLLHDFATGRLVTHFVSLGKGA